MHEYSLVQALVARVEAEARGAARSQSTGSPCASASCPGVDPELLPDRLRDLPRRARSAREAPLALTRVAGELVLPALPARPSRAARSCAAPPARRPPSSTPGSDALTLDGDRDGGALMCTTCGCGDTELVPVELHEKILAGNDRAARHNREHFVESGVLALNLMGSPGAGKTAVLEATARAAGAKRWRLGAVSRGPRDRQRRAAAREGRHPVAARSRPARPATSTRSSCTGRCTTSPGGSWTSSSSRTSGTSSAPRSTTSARPRTWSSLSVTEGEDKPLKYPVMFKAADLVLLTKCDLVPHLDVDLAKVHDALARVMPRPRASSRSRRGPGRVWTGGSAGSRSCAPAWRGAAAGPGAARPRARRGMGTSTSTATATRTGAGPRALTAGLSPAAARAPSRRRRSRGARRRAPPRHGPPRPRPRRRPTAPSRGGSVARHRGDAARTPRGCRRARR